MPATRWSTSAPGERELARCDHPFPECQTCANREFDPQQCDSCVDGSNYEFDDEDYLTIQHFLQPFMKLNEAA